MDSEELKPPCDCIEQNSSGAWYVYDCQCTNSGDLIEASSWCGEMNEKAKHNTRPSVSKEPCGELVGKIAAWVDENAYAEPYDFDDDPPGEFEPMNGGDLVVGVDKLKQFLSALQSSRGVDAESLVEKLFDLGDEPGSPVTRIQFKAGKYPHNEKSQGGMCREALIEFFKQILEDSNNG